jgi:hypothetical protein
MRKFALFGAAAILATTLATPLIAQEATQEPGMIGFNYPNSRYMTGGYGVRTPYNSGRYPRMFAAPRVIEYDAPGVYVGPAGVGPVGVTVAPVDSYAYDAYEPY